MNITKQIDHSAKKDDVLWAISWPNSSKALRIRADGSALLDYRTYIDLSIEARRGGKWELALRACQVENPQRWFGHGPMLSRSISNA